MKHVLTIGNFDGIHLGHRRLLTLMLEQAAQRELQPVVITYTRHPAYTLNPHPQALDLMPPQIRNAKLKSMGINEIEMLTFSPDFARTTADDFLHNYLMPKYEPELIVVGFDSHFGYKREGDYSFLQSHSQVYGYDLLYVEPELFQGNPISSSLIRSMLQKAELKLANQLLGEPYSLYGTVIRGRGAGRGLGFPTANLKLDHPQQLIPACGIYLSKVHLGDQDYYGLTNIGYSPTLVSAGNLVIETFILDFDRDIYGDRITVQLLDYLREEKVFSSRAELVNAMQSDLALARNLIRSYP